MNKIDSVEKKIAMMTENGFNEAEFITLQKAIMGKNAHTKIISSHIGLVFIVIQRQEMELVMPWIMRCQKH